MTMSGTTSLATFVREPSSSALEVLLVRLDAGVTGDSRITGSAAGGFVGAAGAFVGAAGARWSEPPGRHQPVSPVRRREPQVRRPEPRV
jgi:hypothetical protein